MPSNENRNYPDLVAIARHTENKKNKSPDEYKDWNRIQSHANVILARADGMAQLEDMIVAWLDTGRPSHNARAIAKMIRDGKYLRY